MSKKFKKIILASSNEVSLCSKYNSGANKQTEFEIVKDEQGARDRDINGVIKNLVKFIDFYDEATVEVEQEHDAFKDFLNYWLEYDINNAYYHILSEALQNALSDICYKDLTKEEKVVEYEKLFNMFIEEYKSLPITKTQDGKYEVSLVSKSHTKEVETNPQNETDNITKEKTTKMEKTEQLSVIEKVTELLKSAFGLEKTETPAEEQPEVQPEAIEEAPAEEAKEVEQVEEPAENAEEPAQEAEVEAPVVVEAVEKTENEEVQEEVEVEEPKTEEVVEAEPEQVEEPVEEVKEEINAELEEVVKAKLAVEKELAELKKANEEKAIEIEKMSFIQKAKDEYSMLVGTPEEIGATLYSISKSNLDEESKSFVLEQLKKVSVNNKELTEEVGSISKSADDMTDEERVYAKAEEIAKAKNISIKKALREVR